MWRWVSVAVAVLLSAVCALPASAAPPDAPTACRVDRPDGLWPGDYVNDWDTNLHHGLNSDWTKQVRPIGTVKALMIFVDFSDAPASAANPNQGGRDWRVPQSYWDFLEPSVEMFKQASNGRFTLDVDLAPQWHRMPEPSTTYGMTRATFSIANQKAYARKAVQAADPHVNFAGYDLVYIMPPRNATQIAFSPELNLYSDQIVADGTVVKNGATYGQDMFTWGPKIVNHETGHAISLPESYNGSGTGATHLWVGGWDLMGNILGHAPEFMSWNKWKLGWLDDPDFGCLASATGRPSTRSRRCRLPSDGGVSKKGVVVRTSPTTAVVAELRAPVGLDATTTATPGASRMCDWGVLLYRIDVTVLNSYGSIKVLDAMPGSTGGGCTGDVDIATLGRGQGDGPSKFVDTQTGTTFEVLSIEDGVSARLKVTRAATRITATPGAPLTVGVAGAQNNAPAGATYAWAFGDGTTGEGATATHAYAAPGRYPVTLTVRDGDTVLGTATETVTAYAPAAGTVAVQTAPAVAGERTTVRADAAGQDITFEVRRRGVSVAKQVVPLDGQGRASFSYSSPVAATDTVTACVDASATCGTADVEWWFRPGGAAELWDGETLAGWSAVGAGSFSRNYLNALATSAGTTSANPGVLWYSARKFKDFELSVDYRVAAVGNNGGVLLRFPAPANVADADSGYQVAILDNGAAGVRTGAITQERGTVTSFAPSSATNFKPTREWNTLKIRAVGRHLAGVPQRRAGERVPRGEPQRRRGLHRPRERRQQRHVPQRAGAGARRWRGRRDRPRDARVERRRARASRRSFRAWNATTRPPPARW